MEKESGGAIKWPELYLVIGQSETAAARSVSSAKKDLSKDELIEISDKAALLAVSEIVPTRALSTEQLNLVLLAAEQ